MRRFYLAYSIHQTVSDEFRNTVSEFQLLQEKD